MLFKKAFVVAASLVAILFSVTADAQTNQQQATKPAKELGKAYTIDEMTKLGYKAVVEKVTYSSQFATKEVTFNVFVPSQQAPDYSEQFMVTALDGTPLDETKNGIQAGDDYYIVMQVQVKSGSIDYNYKSNMKIGQFVQMTVTVNGSERNVRPNISGQSIDGVYPVKAGETAIFKIRVSTKGASLPEFPAKK